MNALWQSVWARTALLYALVFVLSSTLVLVLAIYQGERFIDSQIRQRILSEVEFLAFEYAEDGLEELLEETEERIEKSPYDRRLVYVIQSPQGVTIFDDFTVDPQQLGWQARFAPDTDGSLRHFIFYFHQFDNGYTLGVGSDTDAISQYRHTLLRAAGLTLLITVAISLLFGVYVGRRLSMRLLHVTRALQQAAKGQFGTRLSMTRDGYEFAVLSAEINSTLQKVEDLLHNLKHISNGLAHDVRTPLAIVKSRYRAILEHPDTTPDLRKIAEDAERDINSLLSYFESTLLIAELDSGELSQSFTPIALHETVNTMLDSYAPLFDDAGVHVQQSIADDVWVIGDRSLLQRLLANCFDNLLHAGADTLRVDLYKTAQQVVLIIDNTTPPIRDADIPASTHIGNSVRHGLGLKIVGAIAKVHQGKLTVEQSAQRFVCRVTLPVSGAQQVL